MSAYGICCDFQLVISVQYIDRTLERMPVKRNLGLVALACILIGAKFSETPRLLVKDLQRCAPSHTVQDIFAMELKVMAVLDWELHATTAHDFVTVLTAQLPRTSQKRVLHYAQSLLDAAGTDYSWLRARCSVAAIAVVIISLEFAGTWHPDLGSFVALIGDQSEIDKCRSALLELWQAQQTAQLPPPQLASPQKTFHASLE